MSAIPNLEDHVRAALEEDLGTPGDLTAQYFLDPECEMTVDLCAREPGVLAGTEPAVEALRQVDPSLNVELLLNDGAPLERGSIVMRISGKAASIVTAERTALNYLQRLSGVATATKRYVDAVAGTGVKILDTRKTTPGWRYLEKAAVIAGGAVNHRMGLYDMVMVKDNHMLAQRGIAAMQEAIDRLHADHPAVAVEIEVDTLEQLEEVLHLTDVQRVLLDNMPPKVLRQAVAMREASGSSVEFEASGGITLDTIRAVAETGVDFISVGALTHSAVSLDLGLDGKG
ncbi:carboxylating nicotinate-nucleotide diphosphorylase [Sulfuriroseicoccus oceanibius]|uniref:Probable nicotinate-nucleotide pyrophosphorylase [carboxylating] n=1 Tax=Sulfuriroseicoccus oceanibius TaxID=2707525 RepID=A0A6B3LC42_9BACT|nr:carboxylating nicotinate-nucleotide diphosphorylase [Sulfuriroseicoccus oceanibius]QQL45286.1 carboxylating nicotinate-nucleotide diphosphorylase [Sulfuriroseicoccus oceanibius]